MLSNKLLLLKTNAGTAEALTDRFRQTNAIILQSCKLVANNKTAITFDTQQ